MHRSNHYLTIYLLVLTVSIGIFFYFDTTKADQISCPITAEACPATGGACFGVPVGTYVDCGFCNGLASCGSYTTYTCYVKFMESRPETYPTQCFGGQSCVCDPISIVECSVTNVCGVETAGTRDQNGNCSATPAPTPAPTTCSNACGTTATATCGSTCVPPPTPAPTFCSSACGVSTATCGNTCTPPSVPANYGNSCTATSTPNTCGQSNTVTGTIQCNSVCSAYTFLTVPPNPVGYGTACNDGDACTTGETVQCGGACGGGSAVAGCVCSSPPANYGNSCTVTGGVSNACGEVGTATGTIRCDGVCSAFFPGPTVPPNPPGYGTACNDGDACTTGETFQCSGACGGGTICAPTLTVSSFSANPSSGNAPLTSILSASVGGTVTGTINYTFWWNCGYAGTDVSAATSACGSPDGTAGNANGNKFNNVSATSQNSVSHTYTTGTYTSLVIVERGSLAARSATNIVVSNSPPTISAITLTEPDYCSAGPGGIVSWTYTDTENDPQTSYQIQVFTQSGTLAYNSGQVNSINDSAAIPQLQLQFNTAYRVQVMVSQTGGGSSSWVSQTICNGPGCAANDLTWRTPLHAYPRVVFSWAPPNPSGNQTIIFTDAAVFSDGGGSRTWRWTAPRGNPSSGTTAVFNTKYTTPGIYTITDNVTDKDRYACSLSQPVLVQENIPIWKEVGPK